jgi:hypothetical protein
MVMPHPVPRLTIDMLDDFPDDGTRYELGARTTFGGSSAGCATTVI